MRERAAVPRGAIPEVWCRGGGPVRLLEVEPDIARQLDPQTTSAARASLFVETLALARGSWRPDEDPAVRQRDYGLLVLEGLLARRVTLGGRRSVELLGAGDLLRPREPDADDYAIVSHVASWQALLPLRLALLDEPLVAKLARLPGVLPELHGRTIRRSRSLVLRLAIAQLRELDARLHLLFWHLADRWGWRERGAITLPLPLSHELLGELVCAKRRSVGAALDRLAERRLVVRRPTGVWEIHGEPPVDCSATRAVDALAP